MVSNIIKMYILISSVSINLQSCVRIKLKFHLVSSRNLLFQTSVQWWFVYYHIEWMIIIYNKYKFCLSAPVQFLISSQFIIQDILLDFSFITHSHLTLNITIILLIIFQVQLDQYYQQFFILIIS